MKHTVPPAVQLQFESLAIQVCELAALDRQEQNALSYELQTFLQDLYRDGLDQNLSGEQAQARAVTTFGKAPPYS